MFKNLLEQAQEIKPEWFENKPVTLPTVKGLFTIKTDSMGKKTITYN